MEAAVIFRVADSIAGHIRLAIPQPTEGQHIGNQINATMIAAWADFVNMHMRNLEQSLLFGSGGA